MAHRQAVTKQKRRGLAPLVAGLAFAAVVAASVPAVASNDGPFHSTLLPGSIDTSGILPKDAPGTNAGLTPRLAAIAGGVTADSKADQAAELSLRARGPGSLERDGSRYIVSARAGEVTPDLLDGLRAAGAEILSNNAEYGTVDLSVAADDLIAVARVRGVESVSEELAPMVGRVDGAALSGRRADSQTNVNTCQGSVTSEADSQMNAAAARQTFNVDGFGQKVGIISDSFDSGQNSPTRAAQDIATGDLPGPGNPCGHTDPVQVIAEGAPTDEDEGRGMAQLVHDIAPGADIAFATRGTTGPDTMANQIRALKNAGSTVIVDDISFSSEPFFQEGSISTAVDEVTAAGIPYYSSAANSNAIVAGQNVGSFETAAFRPGGDCLSLGAGNSCEDFNAGATNDPSFELILNGGSQLQINFQWAEPRNGVATDYDIFVADETFGFPAPIVASGTTNNLQTQLPFEPVNVQNSDSAAHQYAIIINRDSSTPSGTPRFKFILGRPRLADIEYKTPTTATDIIGPTIFGHNGGANSVSTAAIPYDPSTPVAPETFSSRGPLAYYFGPVSGTTPAAPLATPQLLNKPDLAATDGTQTTFFADNSSGVYRFSGTSAAAPHAAAVAALQKSANPFLSVGDVVGAQAATASPLAGFGHTDVGAGLVNAVGAVGAHPPLVPETTITKEPKKHVFSKSVTYQFESNLPGSQFVCQIDNSKPVLCTSPVRVKHIPYGRHKFFVAALFNNQLDQTPATDKFKRKHKLGRHL